MNLIAGKYVNYQDSLEILSNLDERIERTLSDKPIPITIIIEACNRLAEKINEAEHLPLLMSLGMTEEKAKRELNDVKMMMCKDYLEQRIAIEFDVENSKSIFEPQFYKPFDIRESVKQTWYPLGVLLHIAAGNIDALPVFSVIEGLLSGNINILKLPGSDDGLSVRLLVELIEIEPRLKEYIYVFDYPSERIDLIEKMASCADAVVIWGGEAAVTAVRKLVKPNVKLIEWGHKVSFAYVSGKAVVEGPETDALLKGIAYNMCDTEQLFCNACQGIYVDTEDFEAVVSFAKRFSAILQKCSDEMKRDLSPFTIAQKTLEIETERLEHKPVFKLASTSVIARENPELELSYMYRNCWVKPLPKSKLFQVLRPNKNYLQTAALLCDEEDQLMLENLMFRAGLVTITDGAHMSKGYCGMPHDGEMPLRRYMKKVSVSI